MKYYEISMGEDCDDPWFIDIDNDECSFEPWDLTLAKPLDIDSVPMTCTEGTKLDFNLSTDLSLIVSTRWAELLSTLTQSDFRRIPGVGKGVEGYELIHVTAEIDCIDFERSKVQWVPKDDPDRDRAGKLRDVRVLAIHTDRAAGRHIFRLAGWPVACIVSEEAKSLLEESGMTGMVFWRVDVPIEHWR